MVSRVSRAISSGITTVALALAGSVACKGKGGDETSSGAATDTAGKSNGGDSGAKPDPVVDPLVDRDQEPDDPRATALTIAQSTTPSSIGAKGVSSLGSRLDKISHLFSLAATAKIPGWGAAGQGEPKLARDDDLDTAWQCSFGEAKPCVLGLALPEKAKIEAVRVYGAAGPRFRDYNGHPRIAKLRVHTEAGYVDVSLEDGANHSYVRFDAPIETQYLALEVLATHAGKDNTIVHLAEVEVYGTDGAPRQPIELDPDFAWLSWETGVWSASKGNHTIRQVFVNFARPGQTADAPPSSRRFLRATAVFGQPGDDYLLFERLHGSDCAEARGSYVLFDKRNRMYYPLGDLGGAGAEVYRHAGGRGFAVGWIGEGIFTVKGVVEEAGVLTWKRTPNQPPANGAALLHQWGFETEPLARAQPLGGAVAGCRRAAAGELDPLILAAKLSSSPEDPSSWILCSIGEDALYASAACGKPTRAYQLAGGKLVGKHESKKSEGRGLRLRRVGDRLLIELSTAGDSATLLWSEPGRLLELGVPGGLFVRPPAGCSACDDEWRNPAGELAPSGGDEGGEDFADDSHDEDEDFADEGNDESLPLVDDEDDEDDEPPARPVPPPTPPVSG